MPTIATMRYQLDMSNARNNQVTPKSHVSNVDHGLDRSANKYGYRVEKSRFGEGGDT